MVKKLPTSCPSCSSNLKVTGLGCEECDTVVSGKFELPVLAKISPDDQRFILLFVKSSGSLKEMAHQLDLSYPTVRNMLNDLIIKLSQIENVTNSEL